MGQLYAQIECDLMRDPDLIGAPMARLLYIQCVLYGRENLTDGLIDRRLLPLIAVDIPTPAKHMATLAAKGKVELDPEGWRIPPDVWTKRNPTRAEVEAGRQAATVRKRSQRDRQRSHTDVPPGQSDDVTRGQNGDSPAHARKPEPEPETKPLWVKDPCGSLRAGNELDAEDEAQLDAFYDRLQDVS